MAKKLKVVKQPIADLNEPWSNPEAGTCHDIEDVEDFIKSEFVATKKEAKDGLDKKIGHQVRSQEKGADNNYHLYGFATEDDYLEWLADPDGNAELLLSDVPLPEGGGGSTAASYIVNLLRDGSGDIVTIDNKVILRLRFTSQEYNPISQTSQDTTEGGVLTIQTRLNSSAAWTTRGTVNIQSLPADSTDFVNIDITSMTSSGSQDVRINVKGETTELNTRFLQFKVTKTQLSLQLATLWEQPVTDGVLRLSYYINGAVSKTLNLLIDGQRRMTVTIPGTTTYTETPYQVIISDSDIDTVKINTHGVHTVQAWLSVNDSDVVSDSVVSQHMMVVDPTDTTPYLLLNDLKQQITNWTTEQLFTYALYNPSGKAMSLKLAFMNYEGTTNYMTLDLGEVTPGVRGSLTNVIEIESEDVELNAYMRFYSGESEIHEMIGFTVDNSNNFAPTAGYSMAINPRSRTNDEVNPQTIVDAVTGNVLPSVWRNFGLVSDGWVIDDDNNRCLRVLAGQSIDIDYEAFADYIDTDNRRSLAIEYDFATRNITDEDAPVIKMCSYMDDGLPLGMEFKGISARFLTQSNRVSDDQDVGWLRNKRTHVVLNIVYGINGTSVNMIRIFVNGRCDREFKWETNDVFVQYINNVRTSEGIRIGSTGCDIDIYNFRVYPTALSSADILQNYTAAQADSQTKIAIREANDILGDDGRISYAKAHEKYQTICWEIKSGSHLPAYGDTKKYEALAPRTVIGRFKDGKLFDEYLYNWFLLGQGTSSMTYFGWNIAMNPKTKTDDEAMKAIKGTWVDKDGTEHAGVYRLDEGDPEAAKLVWKANWASSQQTHKLGSVNAFTDLWRIVTGGSTITNTAGYEKCRVSVKQEYFLGFVKIGDNEPEFVGLYTGGAGKGDKPTFGCDTKKFPHYLMLEGCDNGQPLTNHRIPWNDDIQIDDAGEIYMYNGGKQWEICLGSEDNVSYFRSAFNFVYLNSPHIHPFVGSLDELQRSNTVNKQHYYWVTKASGDSAMYDLYRYDDLTSQWVDAGVNKLGEGKYAKLNMATDLGINPTTNVWETVNTQFKNARIARFRENAHLYFKVKDALYHLCFILLIAATDNRAKNTYLYLDYHEGRIVIHFAQDDLDSIKKTDNEGRLNKPYYIETHDTNSEGMPYWNGEENAMYDLFELAFPSEMRDTMKEILAAMATLATSQGALLEVNSNPLMQFMENYYYRVARTIPAVAYNETARIRYEAAAIAWDKNQYTASVHPLAQSLGSQLENELEWMDKRLTYMSSYASYGQFSMNGQGSLTFRSVKTLEGNNPTYDFDLTPAMWLYPAISSGSSTYYGTGNSAPVRVKAGETFTLKGVPSDGNTNIQLHGIDFYSNIGEFGDKPLQGAGFGIAGERLIEFIASAKPVEFRPPTVTATAPMLRKIDLRDRSSVTGALNFSAQNRLEELDIWGTSATQFMVGDPTKITSLQLPATLTKMTLSDFTKLDNEHFSIQGTDSIQTMTFKNCPNLNSQLIMSEICASENMSLSKCDIDGIYWENFPLSYLKRLMNIDSTLKGSIFLSSETNVTFDDKLKMIERWGAIDEKDNELYIKYDRRNLTSATISGQKYISEIGKYKLGITPNTQNANTITGVKWSIENNTYATIDPVTGELTVTKIGTEELAPKAKVTATITVKNTNDVVSEIEATAVIGFYFRKCKLGDYVFADGSYSDEYDKAKTAVGVCFYIDPKDDTKRLAIALQDISTGIQWGLYFNNGSGSWAEGGSDDVNYNIRNVVLEDTPGYSVYNVPTIADNGTRGLTTSTGAASNYITADTYRDEDNLENGGFKELPAGCVMNEMGFTKLTKDIGPYKAGETIPMGLLYTLRIIEHRDTILNDSSVNLELPTGTDEMTEAEHLTYLMGQIVEKTGQAKYRQFYYPAASLCNTFSPSVKTGEALSPLFLPGKWFLPCEGDLARMYWYHRVGYTLGTEGAIYAKAKTDGILTAFTAAWYWSASELSQNYAWIVTFSDGGTYGNYGKYYGNRVRAVVAF